MENALIDWRAEQPYSTIFDDIYFSTDSGVEETQYVFLEQNNLVSRWQNFQQTAFTIAETGFGTGLNFLCAWALWNHMTNAQSKASLNFISVEKYPLSIKDLTKSLSAWPALAQQTSQLLKVYKNLNTGWNLLNFGSVKLSLFIGDIQDFLSSLPTEPIPNSQTLNTQVDAWFLDGFSPSKNPAMWDESLFTTMSQAAHANTTFATFTSAGSVKRGLQKAGFTVNKKPGFGKKREMLFGSFALTPCTKCQKPKSAIVIGAGIAGVTTAHELACRGVKVILLEQHANVAQAASGNPLAIIYPRLSKQKTLPSILSLLAYQFTLQQLKQLDVGSEVFQACGLLQLGFNQRELEKITAIAQKQLYSDIAKLVSAEEGSHLAGLKLDHAALYFKDSGWINPQKICQQLIKNANIELKKSSQVFDIKKEDGVWKVYGANKLNTSQLIAEADILVIAAAEKTTQFLQTQHLALHSVRGQMTMLPASTKTQSLSTVICADGYLTPALAGQHCLGASFAPNDSSAEVRLSDHEANLSSIKNLSYKLYADAIQHINIKNLAGRTSFRCTAIDYLPLLGPILDVPALQAAKLRHNEAPSKLPFLEGLYVNTAHGAKGFTTAPFCAHLLASVICHEPIEVDSVLLSAMDPNRFMLKQMGLKALVKGLEVFRKNVI